MLVWSTIALAQEVPEGDFESAGAYTGWTVTAGPAGNVDEVWSNLRDSQVLAVYRGSGAEIVCSTPFTATTVTASALMFDPYYDGAHSDWWLQDGSGTALVSDNVTPAAATKYSVHQLDVTAACGAVVQLCVEPDRYSEIHYDNLQIKGDPCPQFVDGDGDGFCEQGQDLDHLDGCTGVGEFDAGLSDCDDGDPYVSPLAVEVCNGVDDDCDGIVDDGFDGDGDGWPSCDGDCDDGDGAVHPEAIEACNGVDDDCNGIVDDGFDRDNDGVTTCGGDCDDRDDAVFTGAPERCDGKDDDCDGVVDDGVITTWWPDQDRDGYGDATAAPIDSCDPPPRSSPNGDDCDDTDPDVHPGAADAAGDGRDTDCDGSDAAGAVGGPADRAAAALDRAVGCGCRQAPTAPAALLVVLLAAVRRRRP